MRLCCVLQPFRELCVVIGLCDKARVRERDWIVTSSTETCRREDSRVGQQVLWSLCIQLVVPRDITAIHQA